MASRLATATIATTFGIAIGYSTSKIEKNAVHDQPKPVFRNTYVSGQSLLKSSDNKPYYAVKGKNEPIDKFVKQSEFSSKEVLFSNGFDKNKFDKNKELVKLILNDNSTVFVESHDALSSCVNVKGQIVDPNIEFK